MPRKSSKKGFYRKKRERGKNEMKEEEEPQNLDIGKQKINHLSSDVLEKEAGDTSCNSSKNTSHPFKDSMVDISSLNTSVSGLNLSVNLHNSEQYMSQQQQRSWFNH